MRIYKCYRFCNFLYGKDRWDTGIGLFGIFSSSLGAWACTTPVTTLLLFWFGFELIETRWWSTGLDFSRNKFEFLLPSIICLNWYMYFILLKKISYPFHLLTLSVSVASDREKSESESFSLFLCIFIEHSFCLIPIKKIFLLII